eukprot:5189650-Amphidinium_carterae.1
MQYFLKHFEWHTATIARTWPLIIVSATHLHDPDLPLNVPPRMYEQASDNTNAYRILWPRD